MAKLVYWSINTGDDANDGLTITTAVRTLTRALAVAVNGDRILCAAGTYPRSVLLASEVSLFIGKNVQITPHKRGRVTWDFEQFLVVGTGYIESNVTVQIVGIQMRNIHPSRWAFSVVAGTPAIHLIDCVVYQESGAANTGAGFNGTTTGVTVENCSFYNLNLAVATSQVRNCYFVDCTTEMSGCSSNYNAFPGNTEVNGIDTDDANSDPGFRDVAGRDFRLDPASDPAAFELFMTSGENMNMIGSTGAHGPWWDPRFGPSRYLSPTVTPDDGMVGSWANDANYEDPGGPSLTGTIVEDTGDFEPIVDLDANPDALSARMRSDVWDWGTSPVEFNTLALSRFIDGIAGSRIDSDRFLPDTFEYRADNATFDPDDDESAGPTWVEFQQFEDLVLTQRYQQFRLTFQLDHTNDVES